MAAFQVRIWRIYTVVEAVQNKRTRGERAYEICGTSAQIYWTRCDSDKEVSNTGCADGRPSLFHSIKERTGHSAGGNRTEWYDPRTSEKRSGALAWLR